MSDVQHISSRDNPRLKEIRKLSQDPGAYRKLGRVWLEGDHLCRAARDRGLAFETVVFAEPLWQSMRFDWAEAASRVLVVPDALMSTLSSLGSAAEMGGVMSLPSATAIEAGIATVVLDRLQDAGNVGSILRSAAAFGFGQVIALKGTAALWAPKVLRAGMGAHFGLRLVESAGPEQLDALQVPCIATSSHAGEWLHRARLPHPCAWLLGHEGQGVSPELAARAKLQIRIAQPGGEESLNVAAAAAICLHASAAAAFG